jgi:hypothetical protein
MNPILLLIFALIISTSSWSQNMRHNGYGTHSDWFFGLNYGGTWHTCDVRNDFRNAGGFVLGRSYGYRQGSPLVLDLRGRFLVGSWQGIDNRLIRPDSTDLLLSGVYDPNLDYAQDSSANVLRNFRTSLAETNLELVLHLNRLREQTRWDVYFFGGLGFTFWNARGNYLNDLDNSRYNFIGLPGSSLAAELDQSFETDLEGSRDGLNVDWMPHLGFGIGYQLGPRVTFGLEHKTTFTRTDLWDGLKQQNLGTTHGMNDIYHYTSLYLRWYLRGSAHRTWRGNTQGSMMNQNPPPCFAPTLTITDPFNSHQSVSTQTIFLQAEIRNINTRNQITLRVNGQFNSNFNYNVHTGQFSSQLLLNPGQNYIEISATNSCGTVSDSRVVVFMPPFNQSTPQPTPQPQVWPPVVTIENPFFSPETVSQPFFNFEAHVLNVVNRSQIQMTLNGIPVTNFNFNAQSGQLLANLSLTPGHNTVVVTANNQAGMDSETAVLIYNQPQTLPAPVVQFINPNMPSSQVNQQSVSVTANVFHVTNKQNITVAVNGVNLPQNSFNFNSSNSTVTFNAQLQVGANTIQITAMNTVGTDSKLITIIYSPVSGQLPPVVNYLNPTSNPSTTLSPFQQVRAVVQNVSSASQIEVWVNNTPVSNFMFNNSSNIVEFSTGLLPGSNTIRIRGTNNVGFDEKSTIVVYTQHNPTLPPVVSITSPAGNPALVTENSVTVEATVLNVELASGIQVTLNGQNVNNFVFNSTTHEVEFVANLNPGINTVVVRGINSAGQAQATQQINYKQPAQLMPPVVTFIQPSTAGQTVSNPSYQMIATVTNVSNSSQIQVKFNGQSVATNLWTFNPTDNTISFQTTLISGLNLFTVTASNNAGTDSKTLSLTYQVPATPCNKPTVVVNTPESTNNSVSTPTVNFEATVNHVSNASEITVFLNGSATQGWNYNAATKKVIGSLNLNQGNNVVEIEAKNACGKQRVTFLYNYLPSTPCLTPVITIINPAAQYQTQENTVQLTATTLNISSASEVQFYVNGSSQAFSFDPATNILTANANLVLGSNVLRFESINNCGKGVAQWTVVRVACNKPILNLSSNVSDGSTITSPEFNLSGTISNVTDAQNISVTKNGVPFNFVFNPVTGSFNISANLTEGTKTIVVSATNSCGTESYTITVTYTKPVLPTPPVVDITDPELTPYNTQQASMTVSAQVLHVTSPSQITAQINGVNVPFVYNPATNTVTLNATWTLGQNNLVISAQNQAGTHSDSKVINYSQPAVVVRPLVVFTNPTTPQHQSENANYTFTGYINNLSDVAQASAKLNGQALSNFGGQVIDGKVHFSVPVVFDNTHTTYTLEIKGQNSAGVSVQTREVKYEALSSDDPTNCIPYVSAVFGVNHKSVVVSSNKELTNVVLKFHDNTTQKFDNLSGFSGTFEASGVHADKCIVGVWIKSGCNSSNDGPNYGEFVPNNSFTGTCQSAATNTEEDNSSSQIGVGSSNCLPSITTVFTDAQKRVTVTSNMNINNVVLKFHDNTTQQFNNLVGKTRTLTGTGIHAGKCIIGVWVKSGCNSSNDGPNYGAYFENTTYNNECATVEPCGPFFSLRSASWEFCLRTPSGNFNRDDLALNSNFFYEGQATSVYFYAISGGGNVKVNGSTFPIQPNRYYLFSGNSQVKVSKNDPSAPGQWMICITTNSVPVSGIDANRPLSPCEDALNPPATNSPRPFNPNMRPQNNPNARPMNTNPNPRQNNQGSTINPGGSNSNTRPSEGGTGGNNSSTTKPKRDSKTVAPSPEQPAPRKEDAEKNTSPNRENSSPNKGERRPN